MPSLFRSSTLSVDQRFRWIAETLDVMVVTNEPILEVRIQFSHLTQSMTAI